MDALSQFMKETGERIRASLVPQWAAEAVVTTEDASRRVWSLAREYRRTWGSTPCACSVCARTSGCPAAWSSPECGQ
jgi:hypothetical protein